MRRTLISLLAAGGLLAGLLGATPAFAVPVAPEPGTAAISAHEEGGSGDTGPRVTWALAAIGAGALVLGSLYLFKRRIGGFPEHPAWVAPITILKSSDSPDETTFGDAPAGGHGHSSPH